MKDAKGLGLAFIMGKFDGIMGLAFDEISVEGVPTPFGRLVESGELDEPVKRICLLIPYHVLCSILMYAEGIVELVAGGGLPHLCTIR